MEKINVAIVGVGSCASALIQGVEYYNRNSSEIGLTYHSIGGYEPKDISFVIGFDIDKRKVNKNLTTAIYSAPNCNMEVISPSENFSCISSSSKVYRGPTFDGFPDHMKKFDDSITFVESDVEPISQKEYCDLLITNRVDVLLNYLPVGSEEGSKFYIENALKSGINVVNCMPSYISTEEMKRLEILAIKHNTTIVGNDMRSAFGASRLSEILQGTMMDSGLMVTQHIQMNMAAGSTQGEEGVINGRTANTDFLNMHDESRLHNKKISKENVLNGQVKARNSSSDGMTLFAGPSLTVIQKPGGEYKSTDNKVCNIDIVAYGFSGAKYELTCRLSVQDSPNSGGVVIDAIRFCKVAREMKIVGFLRGPSAWTQKTPPLDMKTSDAKFECDALSRREYTSITNSQIEGSIDINSLTYSSHSSHSEYF